MDFFRFLNLLYADAFCVDLLSAKELSETIASDAHVQRGKATSTYLYLNVGSIASVLLDRAFREAYVRASHVYLNSSYVKILLWVACATRATKINAEDFFFDVMDICREQKLRVFLLGSTEKGNRRAIANVKKAFRGVAIAGCHGYLWHDRGAMFAKIRRFKPAFLFVGLGLGIQEKWIHTNRSKLQGIGSVVAIGSFIDVLGEVRSLPPPLFKRLCIEWVFRLIREPRRLCKRYLVGGAILVFLFCYGLGRRLVRAVPLLLSERISFL